MANIKDKVWVQRFKEFLTSKSMDTKIPESVLNYLDNIYSGFGQRIQLQKNQIEVLQEEKKRLLRTIGELGEERAKAVLEYDRVMDLLATKELLENPTLAVHA